MALATAARLATPSGDPSSVFGRELVALGAMSSLQFLANIAAQDVDALPNRVEVIRVDTRRGPAKVVEDQPVRYRANMKLV